MFGTYLSSAKRSPSPAQLDDSLSHTLAFISLPPCPDFFLYFGTPLRATSALGVGRLEKKAKLIVVETVVLSPESLSNLADIWLRFIFR